MTTDGVTLGWIIRDILSKHSISVDLFCEQYGFKRSTVFRWIKNEGLIKQMPYRLIEALAEVARITPADIYLRLGIDVQAIPSTDEQLSVDNLQLYPLETLDPGDLKLQEAIKAAWRGKWIYCYDGTLPTALYEYERALVLAQEAKAFRLATYLKLAVCNLQEMIGQPGQAEQLLNEIQDEAAGLAFEARRTQNDQLAFLAERFSVDAKIRWLWTHRWARGAGVESITDGLAFLEAAKISQFYKRFPHPYVFLARCAIELGHVQQALQYIELAELREFSLSNARFPKLELFLDVEPNPQGKKDYSWKEDQILATKADILIAARQPEAAFESYQLIKFHRPPRA